MAWPGHIDSQRIIFYNLLFRHLANNLLLQFTIHSICEALPAAVMFVNMMLIVLMLLDTIDTALLLIVNCVIVTNQRVVKARLTDRGNNAETMAV